MKRLTQLFVVLAGAAALIVPSTAAARTKTVYPGGPVKWAASVQKKTGAGVDSFLINRIVINVGDTVVWNGQSLAAGFHTVDIPKLNGSDLALITATGNTVQGVNDAAGQPFWFDGKVPVLAFNTALFGRSGPKSYNGTTRIDSGLPVGKPQDFKVKFTKPGSYKYFCDVHAGMQGLVIVKPKHAAVPTARQDAAALLKAEKHFAAEAKKLDRTNVKGNQVSVGASSSDGVEVFAMFPATLRVKVGTTVKFFMSKHSREIHTASFGPASYIGPISASFGGPAPDPRAIYPSDPPGGITLGPTTHGNGFASTGVMDSDGKTPTIPAFGAIKFNTAGTYNYQCLIHPFMHGQIIVTS